MMDLLAKSKGGIADRPIILVLILVAVFGVIVLGVILVKKYVPAFKSTDVLKSEKEIAEEEVNRLIVDIEPETKEDPNKPSEEEALAYEMDRILEDAGEVTEVKEDK